MCIDIFCYCTAQAPRIIHHPVGTSAAAPFSAIFTCAAQGFGTVRIEWKRSDSVIPNMANITQLNLHNVAISDLIIPSVNESDAGTYYCIAWANQKGSVSKEAMLLFPGL